MNFQRSQIQYNHLELVTLPVSKGRIFKESSEIIERNRMLSQKNCLHKKFIFFLDLIERTF